MAFKRIFPFSAIVGQDNLKLALILNAIDPFCGGVLIRGEKGTAKSTAVRAFASILPPIKVFSGCKYNCDPEFPDEWCWQCRHREDKVIEERPVSVVTLPLNATEDRLVGGIDFELAIKEGKKILQAGLFASAHRGILYIDEVNLLDDHLVDLLLHVSASGVNVIEREGLSLSHPSRFVLVGSMNPEEGELRPHFVDRFGLCVEVISEKDVSARTEIMLRREEFDSNPREFIARYRESNMALRNRILKARDIILSVVVPRFVRSFIGVLCAEHNVEGHRAELVMEHAARALAAWEGRTEVTINDVKRVAPMVLMHRQRDVSPPPPQEDINNSRENQDSQKPEDNPERNNDNPSSPEMTEHSEMTHHEEYTIEGNFSEGNEYQDSLERPQSKGIEEKIFDIGETFKVKNISSRKDRMFRTGSGRRSRSMVKRKQGRYVRSTHRRITGDLALDATIRAAAPYQVKRKSRLCDNGRSVIILPEDIREKIREKKIGNFLLFVVDASGSMGARGRMVASKGAIMSLLLNAYQKRDKVGMVSFRRNGAEISLPPTSSVERAGKLLANLPVGGKTPLSAGLVKTYQLLKSQFMRDASIRPIVFIITDGRANVATDGKQSPFEEAISIARMMSADERVKFVVIDTEDESIMALGLARHLASALKAQYFKIDDLKADELLKIVKGTMQ